MREKIAVTFDGNPKLSRHKILRGLYDGLDPDEVTLVDSLVIGRGQIEFVISMADQDKREQLALEAFEIVKGFVNSEVTGSTWETVEDDPWNSRETRDELMGC